MSRRAASAALSRLGLPPLIGLAHGSRHPQVAPETRELLEVAGRLAGTRAETAFLDLTAPDLTSVAVDLANSMAESESPARPRRKTRDIEVVVPPLGELGPGAGAERPTAAIVVPLLFTEAFHARVDVPAAIERAAGASGLELVLADILGTGDDMLEVLSARLLATGTTATEPVLLYAVGSSQQTANAAVVDLAARLADRRGASVAAGFATTEPRAGELLATSDPLGAGLPEVGPPGVGTVLPLFAGPGTLLDQLAPVVRASGWRLAAPLGELLAPLIAERYRAGLRELE